MKTIGFQTFRSKYPRQAAGNTSQILDDTHDEDNSPHPPCFRPAEATVIARAKEAKMITLTTAAGSRGIDFDDIRVGILAKLNLERVTIQKSGRIGRNGQFGLVYEIYCEDDLVALERKESPNENDPNGFRTAIFNYEYEKEEINLASIDTQTNERQTKWDLQEQYFHKRQQLIDPSARKHLDAQWATFFNQASDWNSDQLTKDWEHYSQFT